MLTNSHVVTNSAGGRQLDGARRRAGLRRLRRRRPDPRRDRRLGPLQRHGSSSRSIPDDHAVSPVPLGDSSRVVVGEPVAAIGSPFGQESSLAVGVVSATERSIESLTSAYDVSDAIQIDAPINHGNSGGPLLDARGRVIGINAQIRSDSGNAEGVGFAIPINSARRSMEQLIATGKVAYAYVGVTTQDVTPALARRFDLGAQRGALIQAVVEQCAGRPAGLRGSRTSEVFNGIPINLGGDLIVALRRRARSSARPTSPGSSPTASCPGRPSPSPCSAVATGKRETVRVRLVERPANPTR